MNEINHYQLRNKIYKFMVETGAINLLFVSLTGFVQAHIFDDRNRRFVLNDIKDIRDYLGGKRND